MSSGSLHTLSFNLSDRPIYHYHSIMPSHSYMRPLYPLLGWQLVQYPLNCSRDLKTSIPLLGHRDKPPLPLDIPHPTPHTRRCLTPFLGCLASEAPLSTKVPLVPGHSLMGPQSQWSPRRMKRALRMGMRKSVQRGHHCRKRRCPPVTFVDLAVTEASSHACVVLARVEAERTPPCLGAGGRWTRDRCPQ